MLNQGRSEGRMALLKDLSYRVWNAGHGGVYVPVTEDTQPSPYLRVSHRDVTTTTGKLLTLINPALMTRQVFTMSVDRYGIRGHITSLIWSLLCKTMVKVLQPVILNIFLNHFTQKRLWEEVGLVLA